MIVFLFGTSRLVTLLCVRQTLEWNGALTTTKNIEKYQTLNKCCVLQEFELRHPKTQCWNVEYQKGCSKGLVCLVDITCPYNPQSLDSASTESCSAGPATHLRDRESVSLHTSIEMHVGNSMLAVQAIETAALERRSFGGLLSVQPSCQPSARPPRAAYINVFSLFSIVSSSAIQTLQTQSSPVYYSPLPTSFSE
ncbi:hypothetical protein GQ43DRAFT_253812 [Delitschia confertaspora ATCC 74209]|uniref:Uncharacterized protein n=1 Tax=Delitschia confertaspora ATCC 74209 TaxID=1513339 RepID=A0A9P4MUF8_9PLEO|nr:hypothetical protein GQ43DRAFT_253812 [Delitschia confertaspora ATCC 74209]